MLFDLEDYRNWHIIGPDNLPANQVNWIDPYTTARATRDAYLKAVNEYFLASQCMCTPEEAQSMNVKLLEFLDANLVLGPLTREFWNAMISLPIAGQLNVGDKFNVISVNINSQDSNYLAYPAERPQDTWWMQNYKSVAVADEYGEFVYTEMSQQLYDDHKAALVNSQLKVKEIIVISEGGVTNFNDYVAPAVPAWESYPELSGYVRGTNSLTIKDAVVRLIDADGVNHDIVTDENGYYKFSKEMFYNNIAFDHGATASNFNMFVLEHTVGSTASLYDKTNIFQNSFFGAENNREFTWSVQTKMGKPSRRNFKIEFIPDYTNFPSFSGYVKDAAGNPIKDAYVAIKDSWTGACIGQYVKPNGDWGMNFKYNDFGTDRTVLTDENGFYEYTSQMVGEWFHNQLMSVGETPGKLGGRPFDEYFGSREDLIAGNDYTTGLSLQYKESFFALLIPYKQDANLTSIKWEGVKIYDEQDYYASRFKYALNQYNEFQYQRIDLNTHYDIDVDVTVATNDEFRADKITIELERERKNLPVDQNHTFWCESTHGCVKVVYPSTGESFISYGSYNSGWHLNVIGNQDTYSDFYVYSCDTSGKAMGYIKSFNAPTYTKSIDFSNVKYLQYLLFERFYGETIDLSHLEYLTALNINSHLLKNIIGLDNSYRRLSNIYFVNMPIESLDFSGLINLNILTLGYLHKLESLVLSNYIQSMSINNCDVNLDVTGLNRLNNINYNKLTMTSDDVDDLINQLGSTEINYGTINIERISRSSFSDEAYDSLVSQKYWNINLGSKFYDELIVPNKLILTVDDTKIDGEYLNSDTDLDIETTTGYWIGKNWFGQVFGWAPSYYTNDRRVQGEYRFGLQDGTIEIYSCDEYGVPAGEIQSIHFHEFKFSDIDTTQLSSLTNIQFSQGTGELTSLDFRFNTALNTIYLQNSSKVQSIDVTGLTSLQDLEISNCPKIENVIGFSTLTSLVDLGINGLPKLNVLSLEGLSNIRFVYINEVDLYDSTHVDTMLSDLNTNSSTATSALNVQLTTKQAEHDVKLVELQAFDAQEPTDSTLNSERDALQMQWEALQSELSYLVSQGADQSLIDAKQGEVDAKQVELDAKNVEINTKNQARRAIEDQLTVLDSEISDLNSQISNLFSYAQFNTVYMARTSASDTDYASLISYGWNLSIGEEFIAPYTPPVSGYITIGDVGSDTMQFNNQFSILTTTGWAKVVAPGFTGGFNGLSGDPLLFTNEWSGGAGVIINLWSADGVLEFYSCDSHGRPSGSIIYFGKTNDSNRDFYIKSIDISNLTNIDGLNLCRFSEIDTLDLSNNTNLKSLSILGWNNLETITGFENLLNLKNIYIYDTPSLDIPVDFSSMVDLQRIRISIVGINKNSRLNVSGLSKLQMLDLNWTYMISADVDAALSTIDTAGLDSSFDFEYEGHLSWIGSSLEIRFEMGLKHHTEFESAHDSLLDKGWNIYLGDQIIDTIEEPVKGIVRWGMDTTWAALSFSYGSGRSVMLKRADGYTYNAGGMFSYSFDSNTPLSDRFIEFWGTDDYGRPRQDTITHINDPWGTGITSIEVNNIKSIEQIDINQSKITSADFSGMTNLMNVFLPNSSTLQSLNFNGCSKIRYVNVSSCTNLDIDSVLESLDGTGSEGNPIIWGNNSLNANGIVRTHASDTFIESLASKKWDIDVIDPAGTTVVINVTQQQYVFIDVSTTSGVAKIEYPVGSEMYNYYPNGHILYGCRYFSSDNYNTNQISFYPDVTGQVRITSVAAFDNTMLSGEVRMLNFREHGTLVYSTADNLRTLRLGSIPSLTMLSHLSNIELDRLFIISYTNTTLNLSQFKSKGIEICDTNSLQNLILNQDYVKNLVLQNLTQLVSVNIPNTVETLRISSCDLLQIGTSWPSALTKLDLGWHQSITEISGLPTGMKSLTISYLNNLNILDLPNSLVELYISEMPLNGVDLDLTGSNIETISINNSQIASINLTGATNLNSIYLNSTSLDLIGFETTTTKYFYDYYSQKSNYVLVLPDTILEFAIYNSSVIESFDLSVVNDTWLPNSNFYLNNCSNLNGQMVFPTLRLIRLNYSYSNSAPYDFTSVDSRSHLVINGGPVTSLDFTGVSVDGLEISWVSQLSTITGLSGTMSNLYLSYMYELTNLDLSNLVITDSCTLTNLDLDNIPLNITASYLYVYYSSNVNLSGSTIANISNIFYNYGSLNLSNVTCGVELRLWYNYITSAILDGAIIGNINQTNGSLSIYNNRGYTAPGPNQTMQNWTISAVNLKVGYSLGIYGNNQKLNSVSFTGSDTSIRSYGINNNPDITSVSVSFRNTAYFYVVANLNSLVISDAALSSSELSYVGVFRNSGVNTATFIDSFINSVSPTSANNGQLRATSLNLRTSSSTTGFNKLVSQGWTNMSV